MKDKKTQNLFNEYLTKESIFNNKQILSHNYKPPEILHRDQQIQNLASILAPSLRGDEPSNVFIYGTVGTGKTLVIDHVMSQLNEASQKAPSDLEDIYLNCKMRKVADTEYRLLAQLTRELGEDVPSTGLPTEEVYKRFFNNLEDVNGVVIIVLDEIDVLVRKVGDDFLYNLTRINEDLDGTRVSIIGISNDLNFTEYMDARVKSSLSEEEVIFPPYNAVEIKDILKKRAERGFADGVLEDGALSKSAALAAQEHGDARRALDLIRVAGELAERSDEDKVKIEHIDQAEDKIEKDRVLETVKSQPKQSKLALYTILQLTEQEDKVSSGDVYAKYKQITNQSGANTLTQRRVSDLLSELNMLGVINAKVISKGRYGRMRKISLDLPLEIRDNLEEMLETNFSLG